MYRFTSAVLLTMTAFSLNSRAQQSDEVPVSPIRLNGRGFLPHDHPDFPSQVRFERSTFVAGFGATTIESQRIQYHGGPVVTGLPNIYFIWYGTTSSNTMTILTRFTRALTNSPWARINLSYHDGSGNMASSGFVLKDAAYDLDYSLGKVLTDSQVRDLVFNQIRSGKLPLDAHGLYFLFTAADVQITSGFGSEYCGYHTFGTLNNVAIRYALVGNPQHFSGCMAQADKSPNDNPPADGMASVFAHELSEMITDPLLNAWYDVFRGALYENADKCAWTFGTTFRSPNGSVANLNVGGHDYLVQRDWVNAGSGYCGLAY